MPLSRALDESSSALEAASDDDGGDQEECDVERRLAQFVETDAVTKPPIMIEGGLYWGG